MNFADYVYGEFLLNRPNLKIRKSFDESFKLKDKLKYCLTGEQFKLLEEYDKALNKLHAEENKFLIKLVINTFKSMYN